MRENSLKSIPSASRVRRTRPRSMNRKRIPSAVALVCSLILLTGCASGNDPQATPSTAAPTSSTPAETTATPSEVPAETVEPAPQPTPFKTWTDNFDEEPLEPILRDFDENNAAVFAKFYINLINYATNTGDTKMLHKYSAKKCDFCTGWINSVENMYKGGGSFEGFALTLTGYPQITARIDPHIVLKLPVKQDQYTTVDASGDIKESYETEEFPLAMEVTQDKKGHWYATQVGDPE